MGITDYLEVFGCGDAAFDAEDWGYTRWTSSSFYTQMGIDLAYCLTTGPVAVDHVKWGSLKSLYR